MNEVISFSKVYSEIRTSLDTMSRIRLLLTWVTVNGMEKDFPKEKQNIKSLLKKIETQISARSKS